MVKKISDDEACIFIVIIIVISILLFGKSAITFLIIGISTIILIEIRETRETLDVIPKYNIDKYFSRNEYGGEIDSLLVDKNTEKRGYITLPEGNKISVNNFEEPAERHLNPVINIPSTDEKMALLSQRRDSGQKAVSGVFKNRFNMIKKYFDGDLRQNEEKIWWGKGEI